MAHLPREFWAYFMFDHMGLVGAKQTRVCGFDRCENKIVPLRGAIFRAGPSDTSAYLCSRNKTEVTSEAVNMKYTECGVGVARHAVEIMADSMFAADGLQTA